MAKEDYLYICGVLRSKEKKLLSLVDIERMVEAKTAYDALRVFNDTDYADEFPEVVRPEDFNEALNKDQKNLWRMLKKLIPDPKLFRLFYIRFDFHNLKLIFKSKYLGENLDKYASDLGTVPYEILKDYILLEQDKGVPEDIKESIKKAQASFEKNASSYNIDNVLDKEYYKLLLDLAYWLKNDFILRWVVDQINMINIDIYLRTKNLGRSLKFFEEAIVLGGSLTKKTLLDLFEKDLEVAIYEFSKYFDRKLALDFKEFIQKKDFRTLGKALEEYEIRYIKKAKFIAYGPEVVLAYFLANNNSVRNARFIMTGKINDLPSSEIRQRVREVY